MNIGAMEQVTQEAIRRDRAELSRIRTLLSDRPAMTQFIIKQIPVLTRYYAGHVADKLKAYLLGEEE